MIWRKGGRLRRAHVFRASRLSSGNRLFPTQVLITPTTVVHYTPHWFGRQRAFDPYGARRLGARSTPACCSSAMSISRRRGGASPDQLSRPPEGRRRGDEAAYRAVPDRLLPPAAGRTAATPVAQNETRRYTGGPAAPDKPARNCGRSDICRPARRCVAARNRRVRPRDAFPEPRAVAAPRRPASVPERPARGDASTSKS